MEVQRQGSSLDSGNDQSKSSENNGNHGTQSERTAEAGDVTDPLSAEIPCSNGISPRGSAESLTDIVITNVSSLLLPPHIPVIPHAAEKGYSGPAEQTCCMPTRSPGHPSDCSPQDSPVTNGSPPICTPPMVSTGQRAPESAHLPNEHSQPQNKRLPSTPKGQQSLKSNAAHIQEAADGDCCVHCVLACLFCEVLSLCSSLAECLACGLQCDALCCCAEAGGGLACCCEDPCTTLLDCAILEDCCQSSDCLEMCLDCCSICFPA